MVPLSFTPELIVEATSVCDRQCAGCYAQNYLSKRSRNALYEKYPELFLSIEELETAIHSIALDIKERVNILSIRGGEPTRHAQLLELLEVAHAFSHFVYLETHGRWVISKAPDDIEYAQRLMEGIARLGTIVKISFDHMHGLDVSHLKLITEKLTRNSVSWMLAITEEKEEDFFKVLNSCSWVQPTQAFYQAKANHIDELVQPRFGVIHIDGSITSSLTASPEFREPKSLERNANGYI